MGLEVPAHRCLDFPVAPAASSGPGLSPFACMFPPPPPCPARLPTQGLVLSSPNLPQLFGLAPQDSTLLVKVTRTHCLPLLSLTDGPSGPALPSSPSDQLLGRCRAHDSPAWVLSQADSSIQSFFLSPRAQLPPALSLGSLSRLPPHATVSRTGAAHLIHALGHTV